MILWKRWIRSPEAVGGEAAARPTRHAVSQSEVRYIEVDSEDDLPGGATPGQSWEKCWAYVRGATNVESQLRFGMMGHDGQVRWKIIHRGGGP